MGFVVAKVSGFPPSSSILPSSTTTPTLYIHVLPTVHEIFDRPDEPAQYQNLVPRLEFFFWPSTWNGLRIINSVSLFSDTA
jgi:hypothetical protein